MSKRKSAPDDDDINGPVFDEESLRPIINDILLKIKQGDAFEEHELSKDCIKNLLTDEETYEKFERMLGGIWYSDDHTIHPEPSLSERNRMLKRKMYLNTVKDRTAFIKSEIGAYQRNSESSEQEEFVAVEKEDISSNEKEMLPEQKIERAKERKAKFDQKKEDILNEVPQNVKDDFMKVCFTKWGREVYPILQINPFEIKPGTASDLWVKMFQKVSTKQKFRSLHHYCTHVSCASD